MKLETYLEPFVFALCIFSVVIMIALLIGCGPMPVPNPWGPDAGVVGDCVDAGANIAELKCPGWEGSPGTDEEYGTEDDEPWAVVCEDLMSSGMVFTMFPKCIARADTCAEVDECFE